ncbi:hypothetical protein C7974DRAFT_371620 [Boeremia exigua]|uniref:uncharacterized protein n=1 Tax=Boeremia exigua TaxID=749465 RepID=UPI001E8E7A4D|nr:uncharacterized protein C7974DRAFT_371620 [Boeremia exigua]KAH6644506.1 hypothetical protein C7974DRAFT_371620 [Boeremia exigua]
MSGILSEADEYRVRQLEPVVEMFFPEWTLAGSAPPGKPPIDTGAKWAYQKNGCPACMLARLGSDENALFALFAGMYGHLRSRSGGQKGADKVKSKGLRFVRYWMRKHANGDQAVQEAYDLGVELKMLRHDAKVSLRESKQSTRYTRDSLYEPPVTARHCLDDQPDIAVDLSTPFSPKNWMQDDKPIISEDSPRNSRPPSFTDAWNHEHPSDPSASIQPCTPRSTTQSTTDSATRSANSTHLHPVAQDTLTPLPRAPSRHDSMLSPPRPPSSIYTSASRPTSIASFNAPTRNPKQRGHDPLETVEERVDRYRQLIAQEHSERGASCAGAPHGRLLPQPSRGSMYGAFGVAGREGEEFEGVDDTPPPSPVVEDCEEEEEDLVPRGLRVRGFDSAPITVIVGKEEPITYYVHDTRLIASSNFFKKALKNDGKEKSTTTIMLLDQSPMDFKVYIDWLYTGRICTVKDGKEEGAKARNSLGDTVDGE